MLQYARHLLEEPEKITICGSFHTLNPSNFSLSHDRAKTRGKKRQGQRKKESDLLPLCDAA
jgi:hypothetical protein